MRIQPPDGAEPSPLHSARPTIIGLGEVLWDMFPEGAKFGGAPANFACSAAGISAGNADVHVVSSVGDDALGDQAIEFLSTRNIHTGAVQRSSFATGQVLVELDSSGSASYRFADDCAWDNLGWTNELSSLASGCDAVCFGTLGQRSKMSRETIQRFVGSTSDACVRMFDINLRPPCFSDQIVDSSLRLASVLKLNDEELLHLADQYALTGSNEEMLQSLAKSFDLRCVALTRGADGAVLVRGDDLVVAAGRVVDVVDTVGAGDAFSAAIAFGLLNDLKPQTIIDRATEIAAFVCQQAGATPSIPKSIQY